MNFQQLRTILDLTRNRYSVTEVSHLSRITQPGVSRQIRDLEGELGVRSLNATASASRA